MTDRDFWSWNTVIDRELWLGWRLCALTGVLIDCLSAALFITGVGFLVAGCGIILMEAAGWR